MSFALNIGASWSCFQSPFLRLTKLCDAYIYPISSLWYDMTATNKFTQYSSNTGLHDKT